MTARFKQTQFDPEIWEVETRWYYNSGIVTAPSTNKRHSKCVQVHGPIGKKLVIFTIVADHDIPSIPAPEGSDSRIWLEESGIFGRNVIPSTGGDPRYMISGYHLYGLANPDEARYALDLGGTPFIQGNYRTQISQSDFVRFP